MNGNNEIWSTIKVVADCWQEHAARIAVFAQTTSSFEEWLNWEAYYASLKANLNPEAKSNYGDLGAADFQKQADLRLRPPNQPEIIIEVGLTHDGTMRSKWLEKLKQDRAKLEHIAGDKFVRVQMVINACQQPESLTYWNIALSELHATTLPQVKYWFDEAHNLHRIFAWKI